MKCASSFSSFYKIELILKYYLMLLYLKLVVCIKILKNNLNFPIISLPRNKHYAYTFEFHAS